MCNKTLHEVTTMNILQSVDLQNETHEIIFASVFTVEMCQALGV